MEPIPPAPAPIPISAKRPVPGPVIAAQVLMWLHFAALPCLLGAIAMVLLLRMADVESGPVQADEATAMLLTSLVFLLIPAAVLTFVGILAVKLLHGRRWARIATLVFNGFWIALGLFTLIGVAFIPALLPIVFEGAIAACLCTPKAKAWFTGELAGPKGPLVAAWPESRDQ